MIESYLTLFFVIVFLLVAFRVKSILYVDEHNLSIQNELNTFNENFKEIESIENSSGFKLGSGHLYE